MEPPLITMSAVVREFAPVVSAQHDIPFAFFGHSMGALVAFELARNLSLRGANSPVHLVLSGCQAPQYRTPSQQLHKLADQELTNSLANYNGTPAEVLGNPDLMEFMLPAIRADFSIAENYQYKSNRKLDLPISVFAGLDDNNKRTNQVTGWADETTASCEAHWFPGGHFFIKSETNAVLTRLEEVFRADGLLESAPFHEASGYRTDLDNSPPSPNRTDIDPAIARAIN